MSKGSKGYMRQLDGLRAVAVAVVLVHHLIGAGNLPSILKHIPYGYLGVRLFFVLSGFLITGILLRERQAIETKKISAKFALRQFYVRRFLRIFPLYYFVIAITLLIGIEEASRYCLSLATYTFNIELSFQGWYPAYFAHFWSLSIEEQYYIFWPWVILFAPRKHLIPITLFLIALAPIYRFLAYMNEFSTIAIYTFSFSSLDALGVGSLVAILSMNRGGQLFLNRLLTWRFSTLFLSLAVFLQLLLIQGHGWPVYLTFFELVVAFLFAWVVWHASNGFRGLFGRILENCMLVYLGKISYGIYVYHLFVPGLVIFILNSLHLDMLNSEPGVKTLNILTTIAIASISWHLMEAPINNLKRRFKYVPKTN